MVALADHMHEFAWIASKFYFFISDLCPRDNSCINLCFEERILIFLVRPADLVNTFAHLGCCNS